MTWFKVDDGLTTSRKVLSIPRSVRLSAVGLWTLAGAWSAGEELDGHVPSYMVTELGGTPRLVAALVKAGLWVEVEDGAQFSKWAEYQPTRAELEEARAKETERKRRWRERQHPASVPPGQYEGRDPESGHPDPTRPDPTRVKRLPEVTQGGTTGDSEPPLFCRNHPFGGVKCGPCADARRLYAAWEKSQKPKPAPLPPRRAEGMCELHADYPLPCLRCAEAVAS